MADKKLPRDELEALRWFRQRLRHLDKERPRLKTPEKQERLTEALPELPELIEEPSPCPENQQDDPQDGQ
jgi:hypothetical protein